MDDFSQTPERARLVEVLARMLVDSQEVERLLREMGAEVKRVEVQTDITQYLLQQRSLLSQDWRIQDERAA